MIEETNDDDDNVHGEPNKNRLLQPVCQRKGARGMIFKYKGVVFIQYCLYEELYYTPYEIYGDELDKTKEVMTRTAHPSEMWSLCDNTPSFSG